MENYPKLLPKSAHTAHNRIKFGYAIQSCYIKLSGNFLVDGYNSFCGEYNQNQNISTRDIAYVNEISITRNIIITGQVFNVQSCEINVSDLIEYARGNNNNSVIPPQFFEDGKLKIKNDEKLTLPSGIYYFEEIDVSGRAILEFLGPATVVVEGDISVKGQGQIKTNPVFLRIISTGEVNVGGQGIIYGGIVGEEVEVKGDGQIFGGVISFEFEGKGNGAVHFDEGLGLEKVEVYPSEVKIKIGETVQLTAIAKDVYGNEISCVMFEWVSQNSQVAMVDQTGLVEGVGVGRTYVVATTLWFQGRVLIYVVELEHLWAKTYGTPANDWTIWLEVYNIPVLQTADGGLIVASTNDSDDILLLKLDPDGNIQWQKTYTNISYRVILADMIQTYDGGYIFTGAIGPNYFTGTGYDALVVKLDNEGNIQWWKTYDLSDAFERAGRILQTSDGGFILVAGGGDPVIIKLDQDCDVQGYKVFGDPGAGDGFHAFGQTSDGGYIGVGYSFAGVPGGMDFWVVKMDSQGNIQWQRTYGGNGVWDIPYSFHETPDGGFVVVGVTNSFSSTKINDTNIWVLKLNAWGDIQWQKEYGVPNEIDYAFSSLQNSFLTNS